MLIIEMAKIELPGGHIGFTVNLEITKIELPDGHIGFFLNIETIFDLFYLYRLPKKN